ncbi:MAG TPA: hypothetical protein VLF15_08845, partial [Pseudoxanthomonas sp.]|nr:hypothetical protein [Pseudoxanthomonas sp.]
MKKIQPSKSPETPSKHPGLVSPDAADLPELPELPERFSWQLPHVPQHRRPTPEGRYIVVDGQGTAVATVQPSEG